MEKSVVPAGRLTRMARGARRITTIALASSLGACADSAPPAPPKSVSPPSARAATTESAFEKVDAAAERKLAGGAVVVVPKGWFVKTSPDRIALEEPDRELAVTLLEIESATTDAAIAKAWERVGRSAPGKVKRSESRKDVAGWDEVTETSWETPPDARRVGMHVKRKGKRAWAFLVEGKTAALERRGAQVFEIFDLKVPGVEDEDLSPKSVIALDAERAKAFEAFFESARVKTQVPGAAVAIVHDGKIVFEKGFGNKALGKRDAITPRTKFMIGSVTKSLSSLLIAKVVDDGKVKWDTPVKQLLPSFETGDPAFTERLALWHTFCACTGMPRRDAEFVFEYAKVKPESTLTWFAKIKPTTGFGETFQYSNQMTALGGFLAARAAEPNKSLTVAYETAMKSRLFVPMGMNDTTASFEDGRRGNVASPHGLAIGPFGEPIPLTFAAESFVVPVAPAGSVFSTAHDMARYALVELASGKTPEGREVVSSANLLERRKPRVKDGAKGAYGLGLHVSQSSGLEIVEHDGGTFGFTTRFFVVPDKKIGVVVLSNTTGTGFFLVKAASRRFLEVMLGAKERASSELDQALETGRREATRAEEKMTKQPWPDGLAARLTGTWQSDRLGTLVVAPDPKNPKVLRADAGEWSTRLGYGKDDDGTERVFLLDPPFAGFGMRVAAKELELEYFGQDTFRFTKK